MNRFRRRLTYANVVASLSLFIALGGGAYAAIAITSDDIVDETIQSQDIAPEAIRTADIGKQAVTLDRMHDYSVNGAKVVDGSLSSPDIANGSLTGWDIADGSLVGADVEDGSLTGADLGVGLHTVTETTTWVDPDAPHLKTVNVTCPAGETAIGGGGKIETPKWTWKSDYEKKVDLVDSHPQGWGGWTVRAVAEGFAADEPYNELWTLTAYARCAAL
jgi:hypothetical protein